MNKNPHSHHCPDHNARWGCPEWNCESGDVLVCPTCAPNYYPSPKKKPVKTKKKARVSPDVSAFMKAMGAKGGRIGGKRRLETMSAEQRSESARAASDARWGRQRQKEDS